MFNKISKNKLKNALLFKYFFNFFIGPFIILFLFFVVCSILDYILVWLGLVSDDSISWPIIIESFNFIIHQWVFWFAYGMTILVNIIGFVHFIILIIDIILGKTVENEIIEIKDVSQCKELFATFREKKRFLIDTFSRKENCELVLYGEGKKRFYLFWNEKYGDKNKYYKFLKPETKRVKISYFKKSKIIYDLQFLD